MRVDLDETLHLRLPRDLRAALDKAACAADSNVSPIARRALTLGLEAIRSSADDHNPPPLAASAASMQAAA